VNAVDEWHRIIKSGDMSALGELLTEDAVFFSPIVHTPQEGRDLVMLYLTGAGNVLGGDNFKYVKEVRGPNDAVLEFETVVDGITINGVDIISWNDDQKITEFKVMVRPLKAIQLVHGRMKAMLEQLQSA